MRRPCRRLVTPYRRSPKLWQDLFSHVRIITDPKKLAQLNADLASRKRKEELELMTGN
jgi:hypothetical protein